MFYFNLNQRRMFCLSTCFVFIACPFASYALELGDNVYDHFVGFPELCTAVNITNKKESTILEKETIANVDEQDEYGRTALMRAACSRNIKVINELLKNGANINLIDKQGNSALLLVVKAVSFKLENEERLSAILEILLENGADQNIKDNGGRSVLDIAREKNSKNCIAVLEKYIQDKKEIEEIVEFVTERAKEEGLNSIETQEVIDELNEERRIINNLRKLIQYYEDKEFSAEDLANVLSGKIPIEYYGDEEFLISELEKYLSTSPPYYPNYRPGYDHSSIGYVTSLGLCTKSDVGKMKIVSHNGSIIYDGYYYNAHWQVEGAFTEGGTGWACLYFRPADVNCSGGTTRESSDILIYGNAVKKEQGTKRIHFIESVEKSKKTKITEKEGDNESEYIVDNKLAKKELVKNEWREIVADSGELMISFIPAVGPPIAVGFNQILTGEFNAKEIFKGFAWGAADLVGVGFIKKIKNAEKAAIIISKSVSKVTVTKNIGWKVGEDYNKLTAKGTEPLWNTVKRRFWKNKEAALTPEESRELEKLNPGNIERMKQGKPPQQTNRDKIKNLGGNGLESKELHHTPIPRKDGGKEVVDLWPQEHVDVDPFRHLGY